MVGDKGDSDSAGLYSVDWKRIKRMLYRKDAFPRMEVVSWLYYFCAERGWPKLSLERLVPDMKSTDRGDIRAAAANWLNENPDSEGYRQGYITNEAGDYERVEASPFITREFMEALSADIW